ncbi:isochorismate synthase [Halomicrobium urmianum]|uniref:isochorismate synthase n=1 Tax=Halomicrobium urmianum TaxID=1586233 RepID=UPI001CD9A635|nr:isochorismate synthase [Halomicrobium urmianum]
MKRQDAAGADSSPGETGQYAYAARRVDVGSLPRVSAAADERVCWLHPSEPDALALGAAATVEAAGPERFADAQAGLAELFAALESDGDVPEIARPRAYGGLGFFAGEDEGDTWAGFPDARFAVPEAQVVSDDETWLTVTVPADERDALPERLDRWQHRLAAADGGGGALPGATGFDWAMSRAEWERTVDETIERIRRDGLEKVVLAQELTVGLDRPVPVARVLGRLRETYPNCAAFCAAPGPGTAFFGATPETLVALRDGRVETEALAGTTERGESDLEDASLADAMRGDEKYQQENRIVADAIADALRPVAESVSVADPEIKRIANLQHLRRPISATVDGDAHVLDLARRLHPTPAVGGFPPEPAADVIRDVEPFDRGWYAAPVGWVDADGDGTVAVAIRSGLARDRSLSLYGGAGIVDGSDPATEYGEVTSRFEPVLGALEIDLPDER